MGTNAASAPERAFRIEPYDYADARALAPVVLRPAFGRLVWPLQYLGELVTVGSLPAAIREGYGFAWDASRERRMRRALAMARRLRAVTPDVLARWPEAVHAGGREKRK